MPRKKKQDNTQANVQKPVQENIQNNVTQQEFKEIETNNKVNEITPQNNTNFEPQQEPIKKENTNQNNMKFNNISNNNVVLIRTKKYVNAKYIKDVLIKYGIDAKGMKKGDEYIIFVPRSQVSISLEVLNESVEMMMFRYFKKLKNKKWIQGAYCPLLKFFNLP